MVRRPTRRPLVVATTPLALLLLQGCAMIGAAMSPYSEKFSCKNSDHGQSIHPDKAYADAVAGVASKPDPRVTNDKAVFAGAKDRRGAGGAGQPTPYADYRTSLYRELKGLIEAPATPMLKPARTVRTLILPYADRQRPDRLYMPRYVYSILDKPVWVVGGVPAPQTPSGATVPVLGQVKTSPADAGDGAPASEPRQ